MLDQQRKLGEAFEARCLFPPLAGVEVAVRKMIRSPVGLQVSAGGAVQLAGGWGT